MERNNATAAAVLAAGLVVWAGLVGRFWFVADDAYITFRYSRNWALGRGILYNVGEPPVEGYSNFLWMAVAAVAERLHVPVEIAMPALSAALAAVLLGWVFGTLVRHLGIPQVVAAVGTAVLAASPVFGLWSTSGLETMPFALLLFVTFERLVLARQLVGAIVAGLLLCLVRTEGPAWVGVIAVLAGLSAVLERRTIRDAAVFLVVVVAGYLPYFAWRTQHFGTWVSNTTLAKVGFGTYALSQGGQYLVSFWLAMIAPAVLLLALPVAQRRPSIGVPIALMAVAIPTYAVVVGGDYMPMGRLLLPGLAFAVLLATWAASLRPGPGIAVLVVIAGIGILPAFDVNPVPREIREVFHYRDNQRKMRSEYVQWASLREHTTRWIRLGTAMRQVAKPGDRWVTGGIGALGYFSDVFLYDVGGLVCREVAMRPWNDREEKSRSPGHEKTVPNTFFLDREPEFLRAELVEGDDWAAAIPKEVDRWKVGPEVRARYVPDFREVAPFDGVRQFAVLLRRAEPDEDPATLWGSLEPRVRDHR